MVKTCNDWNVDHYTRIGTSFHLIIGTFLLMPKKKRVKIKKQMQMQSLMKIEPSWKMQMQSLIKMKFSWKMKICCVMKMKSSWRIKMQSIMGIKFIWIKTKKRLDSSVINIMIA